MHHATSELSIENAFVHVYDSFYFSISLLAICINMEKQPFQLL